jgi:hypothetical protein
MFYAPQGNGLFIRAPHRRNLPALLHEISAWRPSTADPVILL